MEEKTTTEQKDHPSDDLRSSIESAYEEKADQDVFVEQESSSEPSTEPKNDPETSLNEEIDKNLPQTDEEEQKKPFVEVKKPNQPPKNEEIVEKEEKDPIAKAPQAWKPEAREHWDAIPEQARREIVRHEQQVKEAIRDTVQARQFAQAVQQTLQPYQHFIKAENSNPIQAIDNLMGTAAALRTGNAEQVADLVTQITTQFGTGRFGKEFIQKLDEKLSGKAPKPENPEITALKQQYEQELAPLKQMQQQMQQQQTYYQQQEQQATQAELQQFASQAEFLDDVRMDMADLMDMAANKGKEISFQEAYDRACWANPEIRSVLTKRQQSEQAQQVNQQAQKAKRAAVSVSGSAPLPGTQSSNAQSLRDDIEFAFGNLSR